MRNQGKDCNRIVYIEYQYYQIGYSQEWLMEQAANIGNPITVRREILLQRLHGSSLSPFNQEDITYITETEQKPKYDIWLGEYYRMDIYADLDRRTPYIIGVDCSTGTGGDNNAITVIHPHTLRPVAELECNYIGETKFRMILEEFVHKYVPRAMVCIERNSVGSAIIDAILNTNSTLQNNLYFDRGRDLLNEKMREAEDVESYLRTQSKIKTYYGVYTSGASRDDMFSILARRVAEKKDDFVTHNIIRDLSRLVRKASGRVESGPGFHDDSIMSYLIGLYVYYHGDNIAMFGINRYQEDIGPENRGLKRPDEIDPTLVDPKLIAAVQKQEEQQRQLTMFEDIYRDTMEKSQQESLRLHKAGLIQGDVYANSPDEVIDDEYTGEVPLDIFDF